MLRLHRKEYAREGSCHVVRHEGRRRHAERIDRSTDPQSSGGIPDSGNMVCHHIDERHLVPGTL
jgi:hypothetical protein